MDPHELGSLIDRLAPALQLYARQWSDTPEDVVQEAFLALATRSGSLENAVAWLFRTVRNRAINEGIASRRRRRREAEAAVEAEAWFEPDPADRRESVVDPHSAQTALSSLPIDQREVIVAHLWGGLTFEQIAGISGTSSSTAHRLYHAGLTVLRGRLGIPCRTRSTRKNSN